MFILTKIPMVMLVFLHWLFQRHHSLSICMVGNSLSTRDRSEIFGTGISFAIGDSLAINYAKLLEIMPF